MSALFIDVDSQLDFLYPAGALYVPGAEHIVPAIAGLNRYASAHGIPVLSTVDAHTENDPEFKVWPKHCVAGTTGQHKAAATILTSGQQIIVDKQTVDVFQAPDFLPTIERLHPDRFVVYGVVTEICVLLAVRGLLQLGKPVAVVTDAIKSLTDEASHMALKEMRGKGATLSTFAQVTS
jgi:nicotinamidase/pyrazinamidase